MEKVNYAQVCFKDIFKKCDVTTSSIATMTHILKIFSTFLSQTFCIKDVTEQKMYNIQ